MKYILISDVDIFGKSVEMYSECANLPVLNALFSNERVALEYFTTSKTKFIFPCIEMLDVTCPWFLNYFTNKTHIIDSCKIENTVVTSVVNGAAFKVNLLEYFLPLKRTFKKVKINISIQILQTLTEAIFMKMQLEIGGLVAGDVFLV